MKSKSGSIIWHYFHMLKCLRSRYVYPILMTNSNANNTDKIIELSIPWLEPRGRANNPKRCVSLNYRSPALPMAILCVDKFP